MIAERWVKLRPAPEGIEALVAEPVKDWRWLEHYLQTNIVLSDVLATFPTDPAMRAAVTACRGLRLLRQEYWECLASFILSAAKQIVQIQQMVALLCERFGQPVTVPPSHAPAFTFPAAAELARRTERELRACKLGFRAGHLLGAAHLVADGKIDLARLADLSLADARNELMQIRGVGPKIAHCVLLFAYGFPQAFPVDVWIARALRELYFPRRKPTPKELDKFIMAHFGPQAGYAQQYLFHYMRTRETRGSVSSKAGL
jgi:N-glycosylase/DNA lyase